MSLRSIIDLELNQIDKYRNSPPIPNSWDKYGKNKKKTLACYKHKCPFFSEQFVDEADGEFFGKRVKKFKEPRRVFFCKLGQYPMTDNSNLLPKRDCHARHIKEGNPKNVRRREKVIYK